MNFHATTTLSPAVAEVTVDEIVSQDVGQNPDNGDTTNTVRVTITPTKVKGDHAMVSTTKGIEKLKRNQSVELVLQWHETRELKRQ